MTTFTRLRTASGDRGEEVEREGDPPALRDHEDVGPSGQGWLDHNLTTKTGITKVSDEMSFFSKVRKALKKFFGTERFLCDTCKYDYKDACRNPQRPNATECKEYRPR